MESSLPVFHLLHSRQLRKFARMKTRRTLFTVVADFIAPSTALLFQLLELALTQTAAEESKLIKQP
jgi:hypothetical protein